MPEAKLRLDHLAYPVSDVGKAWQFYSEVLGLPLIGAESGDDWGGRPWLMMIFGLSDARQIALCALRGAQPVASRALPADTRHFAFSVDTETEYSAWKRRLASHGVRFDEEDHGTQQSLYFADPDGTVLEITTPASAAAKGSGARARGVIERWLHG